MATEANTSSRQLAKGLGWFSIGLGLAEVAVPNLVANLIGVSDDSKTRNILRFYGARELAAGVGILAQSNPSGWLWARVAGDAVDLTSLVKAAISEDNNRAKAISATAAVAGVTVADILCALQLSNGKNGNGSSAITSSITISRPVEEIYGFWRNFTRLPEIFDRLESVESAGERRSHWKLTLPMERTMEWDAETTDDQPNSRIAWHSTSATAQHSGEIRFEPATGNRGTKVTVKIRPHGVHATLGKFFGVVPQQHVNIALHNLKQLLELGEIAKSDASIHRGMHPAQPPEEYQVEEPRGEQNRNQQQQDSREGSPAAASI